MRLSLKITSESSLPPAAWSGPSCPLPLPLVIVTTTADGAGQKEVQEKVVQKKEVQKDVKKMPKAEFARGRSGVSSPRFELKLAFMKSLTLVATVFLAGTTTMFANAAPADDKPQPVTTANSSPNPGLSNPSQSPQNQDPP